MIQALFCHRNNPFVIGEFFFVAILLFDLIFLYFGLFSLISGFNSIWFIRFGFTYPSIAFVRLVN
jgi:hypothetical protein